MVNKLNKIRRIICKLIDLYQTELNIIKTNFMMNDVESEIKACCEKKDTKTSRREYFKQYHAKHKDKRKNYYEKNKDKLKEMHKKYYEQNKAKVIEYNKQYYRRTMEKRRENYKKKKEAIENNKVSLST